MNWVNYFLFLTVIISSTAAYSNSNTVCDPLPPPIAKDAAIKIEKAEKLYNWLSQTGDDVVVLAREGHSMSEYGLTFSHAGYAVRADDGLWRIYHNLNTCGTNESDLWIQGVYEFINDELNSYTIATLHLPHEIQMRIKRVLMDPTIIEGLHNSHYNMVAYPFSLTDQNSNGWILMVFAAANSSSVKTIKGGVEWLKSEYYMGSSVKAGYMKRLFADSFIENISTKGQPFSGIVTFNSGDSVLRFMSRYGRANVKCEHGNFGTSICIIPLD